MDKSFSPRRFPALQATADAAASSSDEFSMHAVFSGFSSHPPLPLMALPLICVLQATDPFSRTELSMAQVKPNTELRARIRAYLVERGAGTPSKSGGTPKKQGWGR